MKRAFLVAFIFVSNACADDGPQQLVDGHLYCLHSRESSDCAQLQALLGKSWEAERSEIDWTYGVWKRYGEALRVRRWMWRKTDGSVVEKVLAPNGDLKFSIDGGKELPQAGSPFFMSAGTLKDDTPLFLLGDEKNMPSLGYGAQRNLRSAFGCNKKGFYELYLRTHQDRFGLVAYQRAHDSDVVERYVITGRFDWPNQQVIYDLPPPVSVIFTFDAGQRLPGDPGRSTDFELSLPANDPKKGGVVIQNPRVLGHQSLQFFGDVPEKQVTWEDEDDTPDTVQLMSVKYKLADIFVGDAETGEEWSVQFPVAVSGLYVSGFGLVGGIVEPLGPTIIHFDKEVVIEGIEYAAGADLYVSECQANPSQGETKLHISYTISAAGTRKGGFGEETRNIKSDRIRL